MSLRPLLPVAVLLVAVLPALVLALHQAARGPGGTRGRWWLRTAVVVVLAGMGLGPSVATVTDGQVSVAVDVIFVVDRTGSMSAEDWSADALPRLDGVRHDLPALVTAIPGARYSIIGWDSQATRQLPLTTDARAVRSWSQTVRPEITAYSSGSLIDRPMEALGAALSGAAERKPGHVRLVFFLSDGEQTTPGTPASYAGLAGLIDGGAVLGYGTADGGPMRSYDGALVPDPDAPYILDGSGADAPQAISRIDEDALRAVADQLGLDYVHRAGPDDVAGLLADLDPEEIAADGRQATTQWTLVIWPLALVLSGLLIAEAGITAHTWWPLRRRKER